MGYDGGSRGGARGGFRGGYGNSGRGGGRGGYGGGNNYNRGGYQQQSEGSAEIKRMPPPFPLFILLICGFSDGRVYACC